MLGFCASDAVLGHAIRSLRPRLAATHDLGKYIRLLEVDAELEFRGAAGQSYTVEMRLIDAAGRDVLGAADSYGAGARVLRREVTASRALQIFRNVRFHLPLEELSAENIPALFAEISVRDSDGRTVLGDLCALTQIKAALANGSSRASVRTTRLLRGLDSSLCTANWHGQPRAALLVDLDFDAHNSHQAAIGQGSLLQLTLEGRGADGGCTELASRRVLIDRLQPANGAAEKSSGGVVSCYLDLGTVTDAHLSSKTVLRTRVAALDGTELFSDLKEVNLWELPRFKALLSKLSVEKSGLQPKAPPKLRMVALRVCPEGASRIALNLCIEADLDEALIRGKLGLVFASLGFGTDKTQSIAQKSISATCELHSPQIDLFEVRGASELEVVTLSAVCYLDLPGDLRLDALSLKSLGFAAQELAAQEISVALLSRNGRLLQSLNVPFAEALRKTLAGKQALGFDLEDLDMETKRSKFKLGKFLFG